MLEIWGCGLSMSAAYTQAFTVCGLSLVIIYYAPRGFALGSLIFSSHQKTNI